MSMPSPSELIVILIIVFVLFGAKRLPDIARSFGEGIREFKKTLRSDNEGEQKKNDSDKTEKV